MVALTLPKKVLFVSAQSSHLNPLKVYLQDQGVNLVTCTGMESLFYSLRSCRAAVAVIDANMDELQGLIVAQKIMEFCAKNYCLQPGLLVLSTRQWSQEESKLAKECGGIEAMPCPIEAVQIGPFLVRANRRREADLNFKAAKADIVGSYKKTRSSTNAINAIKKAMPMLGAQGLYLFIEFYEEIGEFEKSLHLISGLVDQSSVRTDLGMLAAKGRLLMKTGDLFNAQKCLQRLDEVCPGNIGRMENLVDLHLRSGQPDAAIDKMKSLVKIHFDRPKYKFELLAKLDRTGFERHAAQFCQEIASGKEALEFFNDQGVRMAKAKKFDDAAYRYSKALDYFPNHKESYRIRFNLALAMLNLDNRGNRKRAISELEKALLTRKDFQKASRLLDQLKS